MVDPGEKANLGRGHGVILGEKEFKFEAAGGIRTLFWADDYDRKQAGVRVARDSRDAWNGFIL